MKRLTFLVLMISTVLSLSAIGAGREAQPLNTSVCSVLAAPASYAGKIVMLRGNISWQTEDLLVYAKCGGTEASGIVLQYASASVRPTPTFDLDNNDALRQFKQYMEARRKDWVPKRPNGVCLGCNFEYCGLVATVVGRFDMVSKEKALHGDGFGNAGGLRFRLVVQSVSDPVAEKCASTSGE